MDKPPAISADHCALPPLDQGGAKACLFNLIIYTHEPRRTQYFQEMAKRVMPRFPCRIIFIQADFTSHDAHLNVQKSTKTNPERGIVCDQITIESSGQNLDRVYFLLFSLLIPDLPIYVLWGQNPSRKSSLLTRLQRFAARLIVDSEATDNLQEFSLDLLNRMTHSPIPIIDMNWARIGGWREVLAQTFDSQERFDQLLTTTEITILFNSRPNDLLQHPETQAMYLQAWLASRLGWEWLSFEETSAGAFHLSYQSPKGAHRIRLAPQLDGHFEAEEILEIEMSAPEYNCHLKRVGPDRIRVQASNQYECALPFTLLMPILKTGRNLMQEIFYQKVSSQYESTLTLISRIH